jgi:hypothetical protein
LASYWQIAHINGKIYFMVRQTNKFKKLSKAFFIIALGSSMCLFGTSLSAVAESDNSFKKCWEELPADPQYSLSQSFRFYRLKTENGSLATLVVLDLNDKQFAIKPFFSKETSSVSNVVKEQKALAGINGGFFNLSDGESTSYVVIDGKNQCNPKTNKALVENPNLAPYLETILNRSEFRILEDNTGKLKAVIAAHKDSIPENWTLVHSLQAGPRLLPKITDEEEAFVRKTPDGKIFDSIGSQKRAARTAIGITRNGHVLLLTVANKKQENFSSGASLDEMAKMLHNLGCNQAINCDGGTSTTMVIAQGDTRDQANHNCHKVVSSEPEKLVKSGIIIEKNTNKVKSRYTGSSFPH